MAGQGTRQQDGVKVALKNLHCYSCGQVIPKGERYVRKDFVKLHYKACPEQKPGESNASGKPADASLS